MGKVTVSRSQVNAWAAQRGGPIEQYVHRTALRTSRYAALAAPVDTRELQRSQESRVERGNGGIPVGVAVSGARHSTWVIKGTGIYGPHGRPITPKRARVLRFKPKGASGYVFAKSVKGMRPRPFLIDALRRAINGR